MVVSRTGAQKRRAGLVKQQNRKNYFINQAAMEDKEGDSIRKHIAIMKLRKAAQIKAKVGLKKK